MQCPYCEFRIFDEDWDVLMAHIEECHPRIFRIEGDRLHGMLRGVEGGAMCVITVSREVGSGGDVIASRVAEVLGYDCVDKKLITEVAHLADVPEFEVERYDEKGVSRLRRFLRELVIPSSPRTLALWGGGFPDDLSASVLVPEQDLAQVSYLDPEKCLSLVRFVVRDFAERGHVVLLGRASQAILADRRDAVHVRTIAPIETRCRWVMEQRGVDRESALALIRETDRSRARYIRNNYGVEWDDPALYHALINTEKTGVDLAVHLIAEMARNSCGASQEVGRD